LILIELAAAATIIDYWNPVMPDAAWSTIFLLVIVSINFMGVRIYGELEYWFALIKIVIVIVFIIIGKFLLFCKLFVSCFRN
jgi:lysine-specific permease